MTDVEKGKPLFLVTNDDGVTAGGITALIKMVKELGEVVVVAPNQSYSGMSHAITVKNPLYLKKILDEPGLTIYKSNGTPVDCVKLAINTLLERKPDFLLSGINHGANSSVSVHYSGTMGAAREGALNAIPSIGFSLLSYDPEANFSEAVKHSKNLLNNIIKQGLHPETFLNINIPAGNKIKGVKVTRQAKGKWEEEFVERLDPRGRKYYWLTGHFKNLEPTATDTDEWALSNNYISVVPCQIDSTDVPSISKFKTLENEV